MRIGLNLTERDQARERERERSRAGKREQREREKAHTRKRERAQREREHWEVPLERLRKNELPITIDGLDSMWAFPLVVVQSRRCPAPSRALAWPGANSVPFWNSP